MNGDVARERSRRIAAPRTERACARPRRRCVPRSRRLPGRCFAAGRAPRRACSPLARTPCPWACAIRANAADPLSACDPRPIDGTRDAIRAIRGSDARPPAASSASRRLETGPRSHPRLARSSARGLCRAEDAVLVRPGARRSSGPRADRGPLIESRRSGPVTYDCSRPIHRCSLERAQRADRRA
jgi:hypothetical protein